MSQTIGDLRHTLMNCIDLVKDGKMSANDAKAVALLAGQVSLSLQVELNARRAEIGLGEMPLGQLAIGKSQGAALPPLPAPPAADVEDATEVVPRAAFPASPWSGLVTRHTLDD